MKSVVSTLAAWLFAAQKTVNRASAPRRKLVIFIS